MTTTRVDGVDLHHEPTGAGEPLRLLHGNGGGGVAWGEIIDTLGGAR